VDASGSFGRGHPLHAVDARLVAEAAVHVFSGDGDGDFLEAAETGLARGEDLVFPSLRFCVSYVHAIEIGGEKCRLVPAGAAADFHDDVFFVQGIGRNEEDFQVRFACSEFCLQVSQFLPGHFLQVGVGSVADQVLRLVEFFFGLDETGIFLHQAGKIGVLAHCLLVVLCLPDEIGILYFGLQFVEPDFKSFESVLHDGPLWMVENIPEWRDVGNPR